MISSFFDDDLRSAIDQFGRTVGPSITTVACACGLISFVVALLRAFKRKKATWIVVAVVSGAFFFCMLLTLINELSKQSLRDIVSPAPLALNATASPPESAVPVKPQKGTISGEEVGLDLPALAERARRAVVLIVCADASGKISKTGSGFFISDDGRIVTNWHVVEGAVSVQAKLEGGAIYNIEGILASSSDLDLAVLKADAHDVQFLSVDKGVRPPQAGTRIAVIGSPLALENTLSEGIVSATRDEGNWLQITAPISPGSSGSPVLDRHGNVIGVATLVITAGQSLNFARSSHELAVLLHDIPTSAKPRAFAPVKQPTVFDDPDFWAAHKANEDNNGAVALEILNRLSRKFPNDPVVLFETGVASFSLGLYEEAFSAFRTYVKTDPTDYGAWANMERAAYNLGMYAEAINAAKQAIHIKPDDPEAWYLLASVYATINQWTLASQAKQKADALEERKKRAQELEQRRRSALEAAKRETKDDPENPHGWFALAEIYSETNQPKLAEEARRKGDELKEQRKWLDGATGTATPGPAEPVSTSPRPKAVVIGNDGSGLHVRSNPDAKSQIVTTVQNGDDVFLEAGVFVNSTPPEPVKWQQVTTKGGYTGWIRGDYLAGFDGGTTASPRTPAPRKNPIRQVIKLSPTEELWVHSEPRADSPALAKLHFGDRVFLEVGRVRTDNPPPTIYWQKVTSVEGYTGWVKADYIAP